MSGQLRAPARQRPVGDGDRRPDQQQEEQGGAEQGAVVGGDGHHLAVIVGNERGKRLGGGEERARQFGHIADNHEHRHCFPGGAGKGEDQHRAQLRRCRAQHHPHDGGAG